MVIVWAPSLNLSVQPFTVDGPPLTMSIWALYPPSQRSVVRYDRLTPSAGGTVVVVVGGTVVDVVGGTVVGGTVVGGTVVEVRAPLKEQATPLMRQFTGSWRAPLRPAT